MTKEFRMTKGNAVLVSRFGILSSLVISHSLMNPVLETPKRSESSLALLTDLYQLTMACGYWKAGTADREAVFHLTFRRAPFGGGYAIAAGIAPALDYLRHLRFTDDDLAYLASLRDGEAAPLFPAGFLDYLRDFRFACTVDA